MLRFNRCVKHLKLDDLEKFHMDLSMFVGIEIRDIMIRLLGEENGHLMVVAYLISVYMGLIFYAG